MCVNCMKFVERESDLSTNGHVPVFTYGPVNAGFKYVMDRPFTVSGACRLIYIFSTELICMFGSQ
jgi:hypothetical protein